MVQRVDVTPDNINIVTYGKGVEVKLYNINIVVYGLYGSKIGLQFQYVRAFDLGADLSRAWVTGINATRSKDNCNLLNVQLLRKHSKNSSNVYIHKKHATTTSTIITRNL